MNSCNMLLVQELANVVWALATLGLAQDAVTFGFWDKWLSSSKDKLPLFVAQELAATIYALWKLELAVPDDYLNQWARVAAERCGDFDSRELINTLYSLTHLNRGPGFVGALFFQRWAGGHSLFFLVVFAVADEGDTDTKPRCWV